MSRSLLKSMLKSGMLYNYQTLCCPLLFLSSIFCTIRVFSNELALCIRWPEVLELQLYHQSFQWMFRLDFLSDWLFYLLAVQGALQSHNLLQHHNLKTSVLWCSVFFMVQLTRPYMTTWKIIAVTIQTLVGKEMFLLFHTPSRRVPWGNLYKLWEAPFPLPWNRQNNSSDRNGWILKSDDLHKLLSEGEVFKKRDYLLVLLWVVAVFCE